MAGQESPKRQREMGISGVMKRRFIRIDEAINNGYSLGMIDGLAIPRLMNDQGKRVRLFFGGPGLVFQYFT